MLVLAKHQPVRGVVVMKKIAVVLVEELDGWLPALETAPDSVLLVALVTLIILAPRLL